MVKHQRRSHQRGVNGTVDFDVSETDSEGESPSTPKSSNAIWAPAPMPALAPGISSASTTHGMYPGPQYSISPNQPFGHRPDFSSAPPSAMGPSPMPQIPPQLHRSASMPHMGPFYVTEHNNPGVATMNTNVLPASHFVPRNHTERPQLDISFSPGGMSQPLQGSSNTFSPASGRSPSITESFYTHQPPQQAPYALQGSPSVDPDHSMVQRQQNQQQSQQSIQESRQQFPPVKHEQDRPAETQHHQPYHAAHAQNDEQQWYPTYQPSIPVSSIQTPLNGPYMGMGTGMYHDAWAVAKLGYEDTPVGALPSNRIGEV